MKEKELCYLYSSDAKHFWFNIRFLLIINRYHDILYFLKIKLWYLEFNFSYQVIRYQEPHIITEQALFISHD